ADDAGNLYFVEFDSCSVRKVLVANGHLATIGSRGCLVDQDQAACYGAYGASFVYNDSQPGSLAVDGAGNLTFNDPPHYLLHRLPAGGSLQTIVGIDTIYGDPSHPLRDGGLATASTVRNLGKVVLDAAGDTYFVDSWSDTTSTFLLHDNRVRRID